MSRLLFAAARGARMEIKWDGKWIPVDYAPTDGDDAQWAERRIHPDDEHLQYGPISTALRGQAIYDTVTPAEVPYIIGHWDFTRDEAFMFTLDELHRSLFLLILAEALADEGL